MRRFLVGIQERQGGLAAFVPGLIQTDLSSEQRSQQQSTKKADAPKDPKGSKGSAPGKAPKANTTAPIHGHEEIGRLGKYFVFLIEKILGKSWNWFRNGSIWFDMSSY